MKHTPEPYGLMQISWVLSFCAAGELARDFYEAGVFLLLVSVVLAVVSILAKTKGE